MKFGFKKFWKGFQYFRHRYFGLRLIILLCILFTFFPDRIIVKLVNIACDALFMANPTIDLACGYRTMEIAGLERKILNHFDTNKDKKTGLTLYGPKGNLRLKASEEEVVKVAIILGYETRSYQEISHQTLNRAKREEKEEYAKVIEKISKAYLRPKDYLKLETWRRGTIKFRNSIIYLATGLRYHSPYPKLFYWEWGRYIKNLPLYLKNVKHSITNYSIIWSKNGRSL